MTHAENILSLWDAGAKRQALRMTESLSLALVQDWDGESTVYELADDSLIYVSGSDLRIGTIADKYAGGRLRVTPDDFFYAQGDPAETIDDTGTETVFEFADGSRVAVNTDGIVRSL